MWISEWIEFHDMAEKSAEEMMEELLRFCNKFYIGLPETIRIYMGSNFVPKKFR